MLSRYTRFGSEIARANIEYRDNLKYHTAATDGTNIYFDPNYFASLSDDDRLFLVAHELMHIKFDHVFRLLGKDGQKRDLDIWNEATDAIINANLERDGFKIKEGYTNRPESLNYSAPQFYEILLQEKQNRKSEDQTDKNQQGDQSGQDAQQRQDSNDQDENNPEEQHFGDDHSLWEEAFEKKQEQQDGKGQSKKADEKSVQSQPNDEVDEQAEFEENRQERKVRAAEHLQRMRDEMLRKSGENLNNSERMNLGDVGDANDSIDLRLLLRREIEKSETVWSQNRSIVENNYAYRLEENDIEDEAETEVMVDVSGSVNLYLVKAFLRMLKPILKHSKLRVGCFNEKYWGMVDIKSVRDIDNFIIPKEARGPCAWTEDWDLAVRSFTKKTEINKIVFTDGEPCPGTMPGEDLSHINVLWLVTSNRNFKPCCGKVINVTEEQLNMMQSCILDTDQPDISSRMR